MRCPGNAGAIWQLVRKSHFRGIKHLSLLAIVGVRGFSGMGEGGTRKTCRCRGNLHTGRSGRF